ncbi:uncharacterized protein LOC118748533 [Rhagoletis pomonella]|uniref:uncharacterized protein LOC118748533 n=1 Tax=Rhagoletis pomonella TaxID=28610 RepID=UPI0017827402|nr:uncharacterized protein LOC118748533 [Rhagoletis pomonella]
MPGHSCTLCKTTWNNKLSMFTPPIDEHMRSEWETACGVKLSQHSRICSMHFYAKDFISAKSKRTNLHPEAVPSLNLNCTSVQSLKSSDNYKKNRATMEQLLFFVNYARKHPEMLTSKFGSVSDLWETLALQLNSMDGAKRTAEKWKETMSTWRSQLKCRARRGRSSGVPEYDQFAFADEEDASQPPKQFKETPGNESETEIITEPEIKIEIKSEIDDENSTNMNEARSFTPEENSETEVTLDFEEELYIKTEGDEDATILESTSTELLDFPTLGFPQTSRSDHFVISRSTTTNTSMKFTETSNNGSIQLISRASIADESKNSSEEAAINRCDGILPHPIEVMEEPSNKNRDTSLVCHPTTASMDKASQGLDEMSIQKKIVPPGSHPPAGNRLKVIQLDNGLLKIIGAPREKTTLDTRRIQIVGAPQEKTTLDSGRRQIIGTPPLATTLDTTRVQIIGEPRLTTPLDTPTKASELVEEEICCTEDSLQPASSLHTPRVPQDPPNVSRKRKMTCLNEMYETVIASMKKRDEREEQMLSVLQGLTVAVTRLADNVKRWEEVLSSCSSD